jgi:hypothetical protein
MNYSRTDLLSMRWHRLTRFMNGRSGRLIKSGLT